MMQRREGTKLEQGAHKGLCGPWFLTLTRPLPRVLLFKLRQKGWGSRNVLQWGWRDTVKHRPTEYGWGSRRLSCGSSHKETRKLCPVRTGTSRKHRQPLDSRVLSSGKLLLSGANREGNRQTTEKQKWRGRESSHTHTCTRTCTHVLHWFIQQIFIEFQALF